MKQKVIHITIPKGYKPNKANGKRPTLIFPDPLDPRFMSDQENNYYTPSIEEFYIGFEFEFYSVEGNLLHRKDDVTEWKSDKCDEDWLNILCSDYEHEDETIHEHYRVKYLNSKDLTELGFEEEYVPNCYTEDDDIQLGYALYLNEDDCIILHYGDKTRLVGIVKQHVYNQHSGNWTANELFKGTIKNKSELIKLMKQLGIWNIKN